MWTPYSGFSGTYSWELNRCLRVRVNRPPDYCLSGVVRSNIIRFWRGRLLTQPPCNPLPTAHSPLHPNPALTCNWTKGLGENIYSCLVARRQTRPRQAGLSPPGLPRGTPSLLNFLCCPSREKWFQAGVHHFQILHFCLGKIVRGEVSVPGGLFWGPSPPQW